MELGLSGWKSSTQPRASHKLSVCPVLLSQALPGSSSRESLELQQEIPGRNEQELTPSLWLRSR